jgi:nucleoid DNA-binding protein
MTKQEFVNVVANATGNSKTNVAVILDIIFDILKKEVTDG